MLVAALLAAAIVAASGEILAGPNGFGKTPLAGSPTKAYHTSCRGDMDQFVDGIPVLNAWLDVGGDYNSEVFQHLFPLDGKWNGDGLPYHRVVGFDMRLANLRNVDAVNGAFQVPMRILVLCLTIMACPSPALYSELPAAECGCCLCRRLRYRCS